MPAFKAPLRDFHFLLGEVFDSRPEVRFQRRFEELAAAGRPVTYEQVVEEITTRDQRDSTRADSPLTCDDSYTRIDSSDLTIDEVVAEMARVIEGETAKNR